MLANQGVYDQNSNAVTLKRAALGSIRAVRSRPRARDVGRPGPFAAGPRAWQAGLDRREDGSESVSEGFLGRGSEMANGACARAAGVVARLVGCRLAAAAFVDALPGAAAVECAGVVRIKARVWGRHDIEIRIV